MAPEVSRKLEKRSIFFADPVEHADGAGFPGRQPNNVASGPAKLPLKRLHLYRWKVEMLFKQLFENLHEFAFSHFQFEG